MSTNKGFLSNLGKLLWAKIEELAAEPTQGEKARQQPSAPPRSGELTEEGDGGVHKRYCDEIDSRNAFVEQFLKRELEPYVEGLTRDDFESLEDDVSRLELELRHGGEAQHGGQSADIQLTLLKEKMVALGHRNQARRGGAGSDWLENSGFWHKR